VLRPLALALAAALALPLAGCAGAPAAALGRIVYRTETRQGARSTLLLTTKPLAVRIDESLPSLTGAPPVAEVHLAPDEMAAVLARLSEQEFFRLPGRDAAPLDESQAPRSVTVDLDVRKFYVAFADLRDATEIERYGRAVRILIAAAQAGPHYAAPR
jgi:hypothetical protein